MTDGDKFRARLLEKLKEPFGDWNDPSWDGNPEGQADDIVEYMVVIRNLWWESEEASWTTT